MSSYYLILIVILGTLSSMMLAAPARVARTDCSKSSAIPSKYDKLTSMFLGAVIRAASRLYKRKPQWMKPAPVTMKFAEKKPNRPIGIDSSFEDFD